MNKKFFYYQYKIGDKMKKELLWDLFKNTGKIEYYIKYKELEQNDKRRSNI